MNYIQHFLAHKPCRSYYREFHLLCVLLLQGTKLQFLVSRIKILSISIVLISFNGQAQVSDDFSDTEFSSNPTWVGATDAFIVDNHRLRLFAPATASTKHLATASEAINNAEWKVSLQMDFNPSSSNFARIYLASDQQVLTEALNGYYVLIGDTPDEVSLYRQSGTSKTKIIDGADGTVNSSVVNVTVRVTRDNLGNWELLIDVGHTGSFVSQGTVFDNTFDASAYIGVYCEYTATRSDDFYFDNFVVSGEPYQDIDPPVISSIGVVSSDEILLQFNEPVDESSAENVTHYSVDHSIGNPSTAILESDGSTVRLSFLQKFKNGITHELTVSGVQDLNTNALFGITESFLFFQPVEVQFKDIVISEVYADQSPLVSLPDAEFIEIYNRSSNPFELKDWILTDGSSDAKFPSHILLPGSYQIITSTGNVGKFGSTAPVIGVPNFPTLNNSGDVLVLKSASGLNVDSIHYSLDWFKNIDKQEGGWSLELIDPDNLCGEGENWAASEHDTGGTPGFQNSVFANKPDLTGPKLVSVFPLTVDRLLLTFDEKLETPLHDNTSFSLDPFVIVEERHFDSSDLRSIRLHLGNELVSRQLYTLTVENLFDCSGNPIQGDHSRLTFALPEPAVPGDILINELLFNPRPNGVDFIEVYNHSDKYINLKNWMMARYENEEIDEPKLISETDVIISPSQYLVFTPDPVNIKSNYPQANEKNFITTPLPGFPDDEGSVALVSPDSMIVDYFHYSEKLHSPLINDEEGVSLERISWSQSTQSGENWNSANSNQGYATPGLPNSNLRNENPVASTITIEPEIFSPGSGSFDFSRIRFQFDQAGFIANVKIFDHQGRLIKTIANNESLGYHGFFRWDGDHDDGGKARAGYYFVWFEVFNLEGTVATFRKRIIVASR